MRDRNDHRLGSHSIIDPDTGQVVQLPFYYGLPKMLNPSDPFDEVQLTAAVTASNLRHTLWFSRRLCQVTRWKIDATVAGGGAQEIGNRGVNGAGFNMGEFIIEDHYGGGSTFQHNPTFTGGFFNYAGQPLTFTNAIQRAMHPPIPLHMLYQVNGRQILCEGATIPFEFTPDGWSSPESNVGGGRETALIYPRFKHFMRVRLEEDTIHMVAWRYSPIDWKASGSTLHDMFLFAGYSVAMWPIFTNALEFFDPVSQRSYASSDITSAWTGATTSELIRAYGSYYVGFYDIPIAQTNWNPPLASPMLGAIISTNNRFAGGPLAVGALAYLYPNDERGRHTTQIDVQAVQPLLATGTDNGNYHLLGFNNGSNDGRCKGWVGQESWIIAKQSVSQVRAEMVRIAKSRGLVLRDPPFDLLPAHLKVGTLLNTSD